MAGRYLHWSFYHVGTRSRARLRLAQLWRHSDSIAKPRAAVPLAERQDVTTGASSDFEQATKMAYAMVTKYGMSSALGAVSVDEVPPPPPPSASLCLPIGIAPRHASICSRSPPLC